MLDKIKWLGHSSFRIEAEQVIYIDPWKLGPSPKADIILITHEHHDHCSPDDVDALCREDTVIITVAGAAGKLGREARIISPGESITVKGVIIEAYPAYNIGKPFHPREAGWVGFVVEIEGTRIYHAGDTDFVPEMRTIEADILLLPVGGKYTMGPEEAAEAAETIGATVAVPMHYGAVVGSEDDARSFQEKAGISVKILKPEH